MHIGIVLLNNAAGCPLGSYKLLLHVHTLQHATRSHGSTEIALTGRAQNAFAKIKVCRLYTAQLLCPNCTGKNCAGACHHVTAGLVEMLCYWHWQTNRDGRIVNTNKPQRLVLLPL